MTNRAVAHVEAIHRQKQFRVGRLDLFQRAVLPFARVFRSERERDLHIETFVAPVADEIDLPFARTADRDVIASSQELKIDDILQKLVDVTAKIPPDDRVPKASNPSHSISRPPPECACRPDPGVERARSRKPPRRP